jgi:separase
MTVALLNVVDLKAALGDLGFSTAGLKKQLANRLSEALQRASSATEHNVRVNMVPAARKPLILALDERLHCLPIEDLAVPREAPVSRVPSLAFALSLATQMRFREWDVTDNLQSMRTCCVVDPDANLPATRHRIKTYLDFEHSCPSKLQLSCASPSNDNKETMEKTNQIVTDMPGCTAYLFCGHGHGSVYLENALENELSSAVLLMGCSSGSFSSEGDFEPRGVPVELLARGIPSVVGMLWDVTDGDMDRFTLRLLHLLANNPSGLIPDLLRDAKNVTKLRKLNGAAPVCYGLPISLAGLEHARQVSHPRVAA